MTEISTVKRAGFVLTCASRFGIVLATFLFCSLGVAAVADGTGPALPHWAIGPFTRCQNGDPVIKPDADAVFNCPMSKMPIHWEAGQVYNPAAVVRDGKIVVLYRAQAGPGNSCSRIGYAESTDGVHFKNDPAPVLFPQEDSESAWEWSGSDRAGGCEDPRIAESPDGSYVVAYTEYNGSRYRLGLATSKDLRHWTKQGAAFAGTKYADRGYKSAAIVHELKNGRLVAAKINGKYWMYFNEHGGNVATSDDLIHWTPLENDKGELLGVLPTRPGFFDSSLDEIGAQAVLTGSGIVVFYNGKNAEAGSGDESIGPGAYSGGQALFDKSDPTHLIGRLDKPYVQPEYPWEKTGLYRSGTTFTEGLVFFKKQWFVYFGCADSFVGAAISPANMSNLMIK